MNINIKGLVGCLSLAALMGCGGSDSSATSQSVNRATDVVSHTVFARDHWSATALKVQAGHKYRIKSVGTASSGGRDNLGRMLSCDANGCDFYARNVSGVWELSSHNPRSAQCGLANGVTTEDGYVVPGDNRGLCCSNMNRVTTSYQGEANDFVERNECSATALSNELLLKVVPEGVEPVEVAPIDIGRAYESNALTFTTTGRVYLSLNDTLGGRANNTGSIQVTFEKSAD